MKTHKMNKYYMFAMKQELSVNFSMKYSLISLNIIKSYIMNMNEIAQKNYFFIRIFLSFYIDSLNIQIFLLFFFGKDTHSYFNMDYLLGNPTNIKFWKKWITMTTVEHFQCLKCNWVWRLSNKNRLEK